MICFVCGKDFQDSLTLIAHIKFYHLNPPITKYYCNAVPVGILIANGVLRNIMAGHDKSEEFKNNDPDNTLGKRRKVEISNLERGSDPVLPERDGPNTDFANAERIQSVVDDIDFNTFQKSLTGSVLKFIGSLYNETTLNRSQIQCIIDSHTALLGGGFLRILKEKVMKNLNDSKDVSEIGAMFDSMQNMYQLLDSEYKRFEIFKDCGAFIPPQSVTVGTTLDEKTNKKGEVEVVPVNWTAQFIPLRDMLKSFLELPGVYDKIMAYMTKLEQNSSDDVENIVQGKLWQQIIKPIFRGKIVFPLEINYDDFKTGKELGSHAGVHKLGAVYFSLACIPPEFKSKLENIFLVLLFHAQDKVHGNLEIFRKVVSELEFLESTGIEVVTESGHFQVYFALIVFLGDNLGVHTALGYVESFSATYFCRRCKVEKNDAKSLTKVNEELLRNEVTTEEDIVTNDVRRTGIKERCIWDVLLSFKSFRNISWDIMHDLAEGALGYDMVNLVNLLIRKGRFTLSVLNARIQGFQYGHTEAGNKPPYIDEVHLRNGKLRLSASEMFVLVRHFGLMVGDLVDRHEDADSWRFYNVILDILDIVTAPTAHVNDSPLLSDLITKHHTLHLKIFQGVGLKPKHHFILHYPEFMSQIGPLERVNVIRYEGKHKELRQAASVVSNRINITHTLATKAQRKYCSRILSQRGFVDSDVDYPSVELTKYFAQLNGYKLFCHVIPPEICNFYCVAWVQVSGTLYKVGDVVVPKLSSEYPVFGNIQYICIDQSSLVYFVLSLYITNAFDEHFYAHEVIPDFNWLFVKQSDLVHPKPTVARRLKDGKNYVTFRHRL